jgi:hypothetical protein
MSAKGQNKKTVNVRKNAVCSDGVFDFLNRLLPLENGHRKLVPHTELGRGAFNGRGGLVRGRSVARVGGSFVCAGGKQGGYRHKRQKEGGNSCVCFHVNTPLGLRRRAIFFSL